MTGAGITSKVDLGDARRGAPPTMVHRFWATVDRLAGRTALRHRDGERWASTSWTDYGAWVRRVAAGLIELGVQPGDRVGIIGDNSASWHAADLAILSAGAVTVPIYQTNAPAQVAQVLADSGAVACFVDNAERLDKVLVERAHLPALGHVITFDGTVDGGAMALADLVVRGERALSADPALVRRRVDAIGPETIATIVYTSGTTGPPRGAVLIHANLAFTADALTSVVSVNESDRFLSFLPLSHIAERITSQFGQIEAGGETWFARSLATVAEDLRDCRPTVFFAVPRVWEKLHEAVLAKLAHAKGLSRFAVAHYLTLAATRFQAPPRRRQRTVAALEWRLLDRIVGAKIRDGLGLDQARILVSGAAPISAALVRWFHGIGLPITEVYGQTEDCGPATLIPPGQMRIGSVGPPLPGVEVRIADDGEVLVRGGSVCSGYWSNETATAALLDADGWMHTGDLGSLDADGWLSITGRKKDLIITSSGQNVAPQLIETRLQAEPLIANAVVVGDGRPYLTALVTLDPQQLSRWAHEHRKLFDPEALTDDPDVIAAVHEAIARVNGEHARIEGIKRFRILPHDLTMERGELTPTMKVKRTVVLDRYAGLVAEMYGD